MIGDWVVESEIEEEVVLDEELEVLKEEVVGEGDEEEQEQYEEEKGEFSVMLLFLLLFSEGRTKFF